MIEYEVNKLDKEIIRAIWLQTDEGSRWDSENKAEEEANIIGQQDKNPFYFIQIEPEAKFVKNKILDDVDYNLDDVTGYILDNYVLSTASNWTNKRIEKYLEQE